MIPTKLHKPEGWRYAGTRYPICNPQGERIEMHTVSVDHLHGPWEAVYCKARETAELIAALPEMWDVVKGLAELPTVSRSAEEMNAWHVGVDDALAKARDLHRRLASGREAKDTP